MGGDEQGFEVVAGGVPVAGSAAGGSGAGDGDCDGLALHDLLRGVATVGAGVGTVLAAAGRSWSLGDEQVRGAVED
ncbi:MAG: hypothetical protein ACKVZ6_07845, partial [Kineosporiaceae bacterium]